ncbi:MAG: SRPBCC family protein [Planctomycetes bacterium]|nr:SRPBCC family protein [Planctomycetota bacterium]
MPPTPQPEPLASRELSFSREINVPREKLFRAWTDPKLVVQWFTPAPWRTTKAELDVRPGGQSFIVMEGPNGEVIPNRGIYLEVAPNEKLVFTDAFVRAWEPSNKAFIVATVTFDDLGGGKTRYTARVQHWNVADTKVHEQMGFYAGWGVATDQLAALAAKL